MRFIKNTLICCAALFVLLIAAEISQACSCVASPTVDIAFEQTPNVVILKLQSVEKYAEGEDGYGYGRVKQSKLIVKKVFKGNLKVGQKLTFAQGGGGDCIWTFEEDEIGAEILFYLWAKPTKEKIWAAFTCSRSGSVKYAAQDLLFLEKVSKVRGKTRLSGMLTQTIFASVEGETSSYNQLSGRKVIITGNGKKIELQTDENGIFEIYDLPAGNYKITPQKIISYKLAGEENDFINVGLQSKSHTEKNISFVIDNRISGKFFDLSGNTLKDVCLKLLTAQGKKTENFYQSDCTDENGYFDFKEIAAGTYVIIINDDGKISADEPFGTFYYPNTLKFEDAAKFNVVAGSYFDDLIISAPQSAETVTISGVLMFEDGKPLEDETVYFTAESENSGDQNTENSNSAETDAKGRFSMKTLKGQKGKLTASMYSYIGEFENCPKLDKIIRATGQEVPKIESLSVEIEAITDLSGIEVKFPFPSCKKAKEE